MREDGPHGICALDVAQDGGVLLNRRLLQEIEPVIPDGFCMDGPGRVLGSGVRVFRAKGELLALIPPPQTCFNCTLGGPGGPGLFVTAGENLRALDLLLEAR